MTREGHGPSLCVRGMHGASAACALIPRRPTAPPATAHRASLPPCAILLIGSLGRRRGRAIGADRGRPAIGLGAPCPRRRVAATGASAATRLREPPAAPPRRPSLAGSCGERAARGAAAECADSIRSNGDAQAARIVRPRPRAGAAGPSRRRTLPAGSRSCCRRRSCWRSSSRRASGCHAHEHRPATLRGAARAHPRRPRRLQPPLRDAEPLHARPVRRPCAGRHEACWRRSPKTPASGSDPNVARLVRGRRPPLELARDPHRALHELRVVLHRLAAPVDDVVLHPDAHVEADREADGVIGSCVAPIEEPSGALAGAGLARARPCRAGRAACRGARPGSACAGRS